MLRKGVCLARAGACRACAVRLVSQVHVRLLVIHTCFISFHAPRARSSHTLPVYATPVQGVDTSHALALLLRLLLPVLLPVLPAYDTAYMNVLLVSKGKHYSCRKAAYAESAWNAVHGCAGRGPEALRVTRRQVPLKSSGRCRICLWNFSHCLILLGPGQIIGEQSL